MEKKKRVFICDDCSQGLLEIMNKFNYFVKKGTELHLTTSKKTTIIDIAKLIKEILKGKGISVEILPSKKKDILQKSINNSSNNFFLKHWRPKYNLRSGITKVIEYYIKKYD